MTDARGGTLKPDRVWISPMKVPDNFQRALPCFSCLWLVLTEIAATLLIDVMYHTASVIAPRTAEGQRRTNIQTQEEDRLFCEGLSFQSGTSLRARCESELGLIRARQSARTYNLEGGYP